MHPDHIAVTGDILNIALPGEFAPSRVWLDTVGPAHDVTFVPGNHDAYVRKAAREWHSHWGDFMKGDTTGADQFPFVRRRGDIALIGLSSAITTAPFMATGKIGTQQLHALPDLLDKLGADGLFRVVLIHHPPVTKPSHRFKRLIDADKFRDVLRRHGAELVLHGHDHIHSLVMLDGPSGKIPALGVPSASAVGGEGDLAGYNLYAIAKAGNGWRCEMTARGFKRGTDTIVELGKQESVCHLGGSAEPTSAARHQRGSADHQSRAQKRRRARQLSWRGNSCRSPPSASARSRSIRRAAT